MRIFTQSAIILGLNWLLVPLNFLTGALVARSLGPEGKGILLLLTGTTGVLISLFSLGLPSAGAYFYKQGRYSLGQIMGVGVVLAILTTMIAVLFFVLMADGFIRVFLDSTQNIKIESVWIWLMLGSIPLGLISTMGDVMLIVDGSMKFYATKTLTGGFLGIVLTWLLVLHLPWGISGVMLSQFVTSLVLIGILIYWLVQKKSIAGSRPSLSIIQEMLRIGFKQYSVGLVAMVAKRFDTFLIASMLTVRAAGYYSIAYMLFNQLVNIPRAAMWPLVSKMAGPESLDSRHRQFAVATRIQLVLMLPMIIGIGIVAPWFIQIVYGKVFLPATGAVWAILPAIAFTPLIVNSNAYFTSQGKPGTVFVPAVIAVCAQIATSLFLVPRLGIVGGSLGFTVNQAVTASLLIGLVARDSRIPVREMLLISRGDMAQIYTQASWMLRQQYERIRNFRQKTVTPKAHS